MKKYKVLMCGSDFSVGGGMIAVAKNYLDYKGLKNIEFIYVPTHIEGNVIKRSLIFIKGYLTVLDLLIKKRIDLAHLHTTENGSFFRKGIILRTLKKFKIPTIMHHHIDYQLFYESCNDIKQKFIRDTFSIADMNIMLGECYCNWVIEKSPNARVCKIYNAVNSYDINKYNPDGNLIMFLGWLIDRKGIYEFLQAIKNLDDKFKVVLCGDGKDKIEPVIEQLRIKHRIVHIGWADLKTKERFFSETVINVLPSWREGLPMTILETMAYGIPNVVTNISIMSEVISNDKIGTVVQTKNVEQLTEAIYRIINDRNLRLVQSENSYNLIKNKFDILNHIKQIEEIYLDLLK